MENYAKMQCTVHALQKLCVEQLNDFHIGDAVEAMSHLLTSEIAAGKSNILVEKEKEGYFLK